MIEDRLNISNNLLDNLLKVDKIVVINYSILLFFLIFGTGLPWKVKSDLYYEESSDGNIINQILFIFLFLNSLVVILPRINTIWYFIKKEKYLALFVGICILSIIWSNDNFTTLKRSFEIFVLYLVAITTILYGDFPKLLKITRILISLYLIITLFVCLFIPAAIDPNFGTWRGIHGNKNGLAQMGVLTLLLSFLFYRLNRRSLKAIWNYIISLTCIVLIIMAGSSTAISILFILMLIGLVFQAEKLFAVLHIQRFFLQFILIFSVITFLVVFFLFRSEISLITNLFGKDLTLTGRTLFWPYLFDEFKKHFLLGYGFDTFWIMGSSHVNRLFYENDIQVNTAHNGYLDLAVQLGIIGLIPLLLIILSFIKRILKSFDNIALLALIAILITNITESTLFQPKSITTFIFMFFYLNTTKSYLKNKSSYLFNLYEK